MANYHTVAGAKVLVQIDIPSADSTDYNIYLDRAISLRHENIVIFKNGLLLTPGIDYKRFDRHSNELPVNAFPGVDSYPLIERLLIVAPVLATDVFMILYYCFSGDWVDYKEIKNYCLTVVEEMILTGAYGVDIRNYLSGLITTSIDNLETTLTNTTIPGIVDTKVETKLSGITLSDAAGLGLTLKTYIDGLSSDSETLLSSDLKDYIDGITLSDAAGLGLTLKNFIDAITLSDTSGLGLTLKNFIDAISLSDGTGLGKTISNYLDGIDLDSASGVGKLISDYIKTTIDNIDLSSSSTFKTNLESLISTNISTTLESVSLEDASGLGKTIKDYIDSL